ncbi:hypothetical protein CALVIDRAFT_542315 [Calocera viscosa TUFC12733]|uniref:Secreted protein n=1 Tax=Calocera viscosa (strain TUFC12733) TaxID=1330018 RepID=A0A167GS11_CALVF|nr:hypothetical protein CALVIDRAFT_542315 [Calocera viscosa TUFC12733]
MQALQALLLLIRFVCRRVPRAAGCVLASYAIALKDGPAQPACAGVRKYYTSSHQLDLIIVYRSPLRPFRPFTLARPDCTPPRAVPAAIRHG